MKVRLEQANTALKGFDESCKQRLTTLEEKLWKEEYADKAEKELKREKNGAFYNKISRSESV
ncbi:1923_t:CDS:2 [Paraglomus occultum]|uniref:1923_t:CDS:1 n=1 Tax=Paraglomus occultum TaxID=144539 RepID=A0A9N9AJ05_9GLOM|nr:1923_t:CDS:2 [Paraglomus occultum]